MVQRPQTVWPWKFSVTGTATWTGDFDTCPPHHWLIGDLADLPRDQGRCRKCGAVKNFPVVFLDIHYTNLDRPDLTAGERDIVAHVAERRRRET